MSETSPESNSQPIAFGYVIDRPDWPAKEQRELIERYADANLFPIKLFIYEEHAIFGKRSFFERPIGYTIFVTHSNLGDHLIAVVPEIVFRSGHTNIKRAIREKLNVHFVSRRRYRKPLRKRGSFAERERKRKGVPLGWTLYNGELVPDPLFQALGKVAFKMRKLRIRMPTRPELMDLAFAAMHEFPKGPVPPDGDRRRKLKGAAVNEELRLELLTFIEEHPNIRRQTIRESCPDVEAKILHERIKRLKRGKLIAVSEVRRYSITVAGREYARALRAQQQRFLPPVVLPCLGNPGQPSRWDERGPSQRPLPTEPSSVEEIQFGGDRRRRLPRNSAPARHGESLRLLTPDPPAAPRSISLGFERPPREHASESNASVSDSSRSSDDGCAR